MSIYYSLFSLILCMNVPQYVWRHILELWEWNWEEADLLRWEKLSVWFWHFTVTLFLLRIQVKVRLKKNMGVRIASRRKQYVWYKRALDLKTLRSFLNFLIVLFGIIQWNMWGRGCFLFSLCEWIEIEGTCPFYRVSVW